MILQHLYNLVHVDLSYNLLRLLESAHTHLGNIKTLNLCGNQLDQLAGLSKLYSLVNLDLSHNQLAMVTWQRPPPPLPLRWLLAGTHACVSSWTGPRTSARCRVWRSSASAVIPCASSQTTEPKSWPSLGTEQQRYSWGGRGGSKRVRIRWTRVVCFCWVQVCLDGQVTTEKELDTVEVLKAIQKARDVKEKKASSVSKVLCPAPPTAGRLSSNPQTAF